jgi:hypothetical protein
MHPLLSASAERQLGLFTAADARRAGYQHAEIRRLCASGTWVRLARGVYMTADGLAAAEEGRRRHQVDCLAVLLLLSRRTAVISHESAARLWGFPVRGRHLGAVRLTDPTLSRRGHGYTVTQAPLRNGDVMRSGPLRLTSAVRTLVDCARRWPLGDAVVALDAALLSGKVTPEGLADGVASLTTCPLETRGRLRIVGAELPTPELQVEIRTAGRLVAVVDAWFEKAAVAVEFDGRIKYSDPWRERSPARVLWEEKRREDELRALDIRVVRVAYDDLGARWPLLEARLRDLIASPGPPVRRFTSTARVLGVQRSG